MPNQDNISALVTGAIVIIIIVIVIYVMTKTNSNFDNTSGQIEEKDDDEIDDSQLPPVEPKKRIKIRKSR